MALIEILTTQFTNIPTSKTWREMDNFVDTTMLMPDLLQTRIEDYNQQFGYEGLRYGPGVLLITNPIYDPLNGVQILTITNQTIAFADGTTDPVLFGTPIPYVNGTSANLPAQAPDRTVGLRMLLAFVSDPPDRGLWGYSVLGGGWEKLTSN